MKFSRQEYWSGLAVPAPVIVHMLMYMDIHIPNLWVLFHPYLSLSHCPTGKLNLQLALETQRAVF